MSDAPRAKQTNLRTHYFKVIEHGTKLFNAHRLLAWAQAQAEGAQRKLKIALLNAYQGRAECIEDVEVLLACVAEAGLDTAAARQVLESDAYADEVRAVEQMYQRAGVNSVPAIIINEQYLISGGQPVEVFEKSLREIAAKAAWHADE